MSSRRLVLGVAFLAATFFGGQAEAYLSKEVRAWSVDCSNGLTCNMSFWDWDAKGVQYVSFQRKGALEAPLELRLRTAPDFSPDADPTVTFRFIVDGQERLVLAGKDLTQDESGNAYLYSDRDQVLALLGAMAAGKTAEATVTGKAGSQALTVRLDGVKGAMLYVDEVQGRLGRTDALEAKGDKPPSAEATAKDVLTLEDMPEIVRKDFTDPGGACSDIEPETIRQFGGFDVAVGAIHLIGVPCTTGGAYNQPYALYVVNETVERISFPFMNEGKPTAMTTAMNIDFDPVAKTLTSFFRGRGIGDCGEYFKWSFDERFERLHLLEMRNKPDCDEGENDPAKFPLVWKATQ